jgi:PKD repeat protein
LDAGAGFVSYTWNGSIGAQIYNPTATGLYTVIVEDNNGCTATDFVNVTINESPALVMSLTNESGTGLNDGTATVTISGGLNPYDVLWNNMETTETITGLTGGLYSVVVTDDNGCTAYDEVTVNTLNAAPVADFSVDFIEGCAPLTVNFTDESTNFPLTWLWNFDGTITANTQNTSFTFDTPGTYNVSLFVENLDGSDTYQVEINVFANPTPELGDNITECDGNSVVLDASDAYATYEWTGEFDTQTIDVTVAGDYYVTVTTVNGCTGTDMISIFFNPSPVIDLGDDFSICENIEYTLDAGDGFASYLWNGSIVGQTLIVTEAGTYTVEVTNNFYCPATDAVTISELPAPSVDLPATIDACVNEEFTYELTETYEAVVWSDATTEHTFTNTWTEVGDYEISVTVYLGTCTDIDYMTVNVDICENVDITDSDQFIGLYPNPANALSYLIIKGYTGEISYVLVDAQGKEIVAKTIGVNSDYSEELDLENLVPGMYFVRVTTDNKVTNLKLIRK